MPHKVDICVCTYNRTSLEKTLESISGQDFGRDQFAVIVADNAEEPHRREWIEGLGVKYSLRLTYVHAPARNISIARNACLDAASADEVAFLDDDEWVGETWLTNLSRALGEADGAAAVFGPVFGIYGENAPKWFVNSGIHDTAPQIAANGAVSNGYTCNVIMRRSAIGAHRFALELGRTGGEDTEFFSRVLAAGQTVAFCPSAPAYEKVGDERLNLSWLMKRGFRSGQTHGRLLLAKSINRGGEIGLAALKMTYSAGTVALNAFAPVGRTRALIRTSLHAGVVCRLAGVNEIKLY